jgi:hypothetical protein
MLGSTAKRRRCGISVEPNLQRLQAPSGDSNHKMWFMVSRWACGGNFALDVRRATP